METNSTYSNNFQDDLTLDKLNELIELIEKIGKLPDSYQEIAKSKGFDLNAGDQMVIPYRFAIRYKLPLRKNVHFSDVDNIYLFKNPYPGILKYKMGY